jgi:hypothetical protein
MTSSVHPVRGLDVLDKDSLGFEPLEGSKPLDLNGLLEST